MTTSPDYSGTAVTVFVLELADGTRLWRNSCPVDCGWHGSDRESKVIAEQALAADAKAHQCLRTARGQEQT